MQRAGLNAHDFAAYLGQLRMSHTSVWECHVLHLDTMQPFRTIPAGKVLDGQIDIDATQYPTRKATVVIADPGHTFGYDTTSAGITASLGPVAFRLVHRVWVENLGRFVSCPAFTGKVWGGQRDATSVTLSMLGMESQALGNAGRSVTYKKGQRKTDVIRAILADLAGETRFDIPTLAARLPQDVALSRLSVPWTEARKIASSMNRQLFYDATGRACLRAHGTKPVIRFRSTGLNEVLHASDIVGDVQVGWDLTGMSWFNEVEVLGPKPKGGKKRIQETAVAPAGHFLNPGHLGRNDVPLRRINSIQDDKARTKAEASARAKRVLTDQLRQVLNVTASVLVMPFLEERDLFAVSTPGGHGESRLLQATIPLTEGQGMSIGYRKRIATHTAPRPHHALAKETEL